MMKIRKATEAIEAGRTVLGLELGSTRIKAVLLDTEARTLASGSYGWENALEHGVWTYALDDVWRGVQAAYESVAKNVGDTYHVKLTKIGAVGVSAMMHGYLAFDEGGKLLAPFRTWRNNITGEAAEKLSELFHFHIPQRWSVAHIEQALLNQEAHTKDIAFLTTLAGYVHWQLTGEKVLGVGDASGMFPIDAATGTYREDFLRLFDELPEAKAMPWKLKDLLPEALPAGHAAGHLTEAGAKLLDPTGGLAPGALAAPPEGDAGTGMVSTNAVRKRTGNISVGTSAFSMHVLEHDLAQPHRDIDIVTTPDGAPVAMVHVNNCSSDINAWAGLFGAFAKAAGLDLAPDKLYGLLFEQVSTADKDAGGLMNYACLSGENITDVAAGRPLFLRAPHSRFTLANFMLAQLLSAFAPLAIGMKALKDEHVAMDSLVAQGGLFRTPIVAQQVLADMLGVPITVMASAGEGGPWGMGVLALYTLLSTEGETRPLADFLDSEIFRDTEATCREPTVAGEKGAAVFTAAYEKALDLERAAGEALEDRE